MPFLAHPLFVTYCWLKHWAVLPTVILTILALTLMASPAGSSMATPQNGRLYLTPSPTTPKTVDHYSAVVKAPVPLLALQNVDMAPDGLESGPALPEAPAEAAFMAVVPLKSNNQALMVDATLNQMVTGTFVVDTGATYTSISRDMAKQMGIDLVNCEHIVITTANGRIEVPKVLIKRLDVKGLEAKNVEATVIDIHKGASFNGLLGLSFIKQFKLTIDANAGRLIFQRG
jgi:clan AA aspartic protease (TIGR02281 family)